MPTTSKLQVVGKHLLILTVCLMFSLAYVQFLKFILAMSIKNPVGIAIPFDFI